MAIFGKKKFTLEELLKGVQELSTEEQAKFLEHLQGMGEKAEEKENDEAVEEVENGEDVETEEEKIKEKTEELDEAKKDEGAAKETETEVELEEDKQFSEDESARDEMAASNRDELVHQLTDKVNALAEEVKELLELKRLMEEYTQKQADQFGYKGNVLGAKKDYRDMSTEELKARQMKGI